MKCMCLVCEKEWRRLERAEVPLPDRVFVWLTVAVIPFVYAMVQAFVWLVS